jgi:hypothetical protein
LNFTGGAALAAGSVAGGIVTFTWEDPVQMLPWGGINLTSTGGAPSAPSTITNAVLDHAQAAAVIATDAGHPVNISGTTVQNYTNSALDLESPNSTVLNSTVDGAGTPSTAAAVILGGAGITFSARVKNSLGAGVTIMAANVTLSNCEVTANRNGILVFSIGAGNSVAIHGCNLTNNLEAALSNPNAGQFVDAEGNWWGSVAGPSASNPNSVFGADTTNWLLAPVTLSY